MPKAKMMRAIAGPMNFCIFLVEVSRKGGLCQLVVLDVNDLTFLNVFAVYRNSESPSEGVGH